MDRRHRQVQCRWQFQSRRPTDMLHVPLAAHTGLLQVALLKGNLQNIPKPSTQAFQFRRCLYSEQLVHQSCWQLAANGQPQYSTRACSNPGGCSATCEGLETRSSGHYKLRLVC